MRYNYIVSLVFAFFAVLLLLGICAHGPATGEGAPRITEDRIVGADD